MFVALMKAFFITLWHLFFSRRLRSFFSCARFLLWGRCVRLSFCLLPLLLFTFGANNIFSLAFSCYIHLNLSELSAPCQKNICRDLWRAHKNNKKKTTKLKILTIKMSVRWNVREEDDQVFFSPIFLFTIFDDSNVNDFIKISVRCEHHARRVKVQSNI